VTFTNFSTTTMVEERGSKQQEAFFTVCCINFSISSLCGLSQAYCVLHSTYSKV